ncbi:RNA polymerase, sigma-24 subunit, ECF subfamily [Kribbella flavida DSM 17836]|uniref:RNA polymerase, sigma-24 subunit, ECF subfamily n=1 Tax=Kribbella flavida (strain DSM 17836 / JCM 10339 / NBRC 14399) TaxID=479435 RepID=D2Q1G7_KRIFD|nr:SigE family RNA polymerase sigma factor [Kribbella flavida]ADB30155.1 RNA polymerase, sigma-24 subunit, ECF subfamily [Kribbella flavida DSM 17836]
MTTDDGPPDFDTWVSHRGAGLLRFAYLVTRDRGRAEEAVQDALVAAYPRWSRIGADPDAYVRRCIVNADISRWRRFFRRETPVDDPAVFVDLGEPAVGGSTTGADHAVLHADADAVWRLCASLPTRQRAAVVLRYYEGLPDAEIAEVLGCTAATVRSQIHRALGSLRATLKEVERL